MRKEFSDHHRHLGDGIDTAAELDLRPHYLEGWSSSGPQNDEGAVIIGASKHEDDQKPEMN